MNFDLYFFNLIFKFSGKQKWLDFLAIFFAEYLAYILILVLLIAIFIFKNVNIFLFPVSIGVFARFMVNEIIYFFYKRKRPSEVLQLKTLIKSPKHPAFPSGHASFFFALSFAILPFSFALGVTFIFLSSLMGFFRVFAGVHWPSDILVGAVVGGASAFISYKLGYILFLWMLSNL